MPDWSYHTLFRPILFALPDEKARDLTLNVMKGLYRLPLGKNIIEIMGHMAPPSVLEKRLFGISFISPVGLTGEIDQRLIGIEPLSLFGSGYIDLGIVTMEPRKGSIKKSLDQRSLQLSDAWMNEGIGYIEHRLKSFMGIPTPKAVRLGFALGATVEEATAERLQLIHRLKDAIDFFIVDTSKQRNWSKEQWRNHLTALLKECEKWQKPLLIGISVFDVHHRERVLESDWYEGIQGIVISDIREEDQAYVGEPNSKNEVISWLQRAKERISLPIIASGGVHEPQDALDLLDAGAELIQVNAGLVFSGPGLVKRINEAVANRCVETKAEIQKLNSPIMGWGAGFLLGICLIIIGAAAWHVAESQVILPYDEKISGLTKAEIDAVNPRILSFMSHDRITLAGTMISLGFIYCFISVFGLRKGHHWTKIIIVASCVIGFGSLFYFLGHGYLDPLHTLLSLFLFPFFLLLVYFSKIAYIPKKSINLLNTRAWRLSLWGQLSFVSLGIALSIAGITISIIGMTGVFVPEDLKFLQTTAESLYDANPDLIPLIAHDRAGFGGTLLSDGIALLLLSLWGFREGERWVWWTLLVAGLPGFIGAIGVHFQIGYVDWFHLSPAFFALFLYLVGLSCSFSYLLAKPKIEYAHAQNQRWIA